MLEYALPLPPCPGSPTVSDIDGNVYNTLLIGNKCWMKENLKVTRYPNGDVIPYISDDEEWAALGDNNTDDAYCLYNNNIYSGYGALYSYAAAIADNWGRDNGVGQGVCPDGWHLPTDTEWTELEEFLIANGYNWDGSTSGNKIGKSLASTYGWENSSYQGGVGNDPASNNATGFTALSGGYRTINTGGFWNSGFFGFWWAATEYSSDYAYGRSMNNNLEYLYRGDYNKSGGFSVRCTRDY
ncbi:MAG: hypothetical protein C0594_01170 [Marinilabiliales bacterium]|nr:MAG: hypothetical protein C0594_01170 [Marinilabiliales bacterium]